jgi:hypothetical protein
LNTEREARIEEYAKLLTDIAQYEANYQTYKLSVESAQEELRDTHQYIFSLTGFSLNELKNIYDSAKNKAEDSYSDVEKKVMDWWDNNKLIVQVNKVA